MMGSLFQTGIDIGSTTVKLVICDGLGEILFSRYCRHNALTVQTVSALLAEARQSLGTVDLDLALTGSASMGVSEFFGFPFLQEVVAVTKLIGPRWPEVRTLIEIGGEDSKIAFLDDHFQPDIRMNGNCAGGTGAFIEQMAVLLNVPLNTFDSLAQQSQTLYPIASRCGVFAKTDIQALLANHCAPADIAASVFHALALQVISSLARGRDIQEKVLFAGGPLTFFPQLRRAFLRILGLEEGSVQACAHPELIAAKGAALCHEVPYPISIDQCISLLADHDPKTREDGSKRLAPLFVNPECYAHWEERHRHHQVPRTTMETLDDCPCFLGIDSGSTTTKLVLMDDGQRVAWTWYTPNHGDPLGSVRKGLDVLRDCCREAGVKPRIIRTGVTGYGEDLIRAAFALDDGVVETMAHFRAARNFVPDVSFILDIGGQDMKAITIRDGAVSDIQINEACSSGCGSFIETFARSLHYSVEEFARLACSAAAPFDLGTRCTVFMNSRVKQAFREGASPGDISAGLACSVIRNSLYKVLKLKDPAVLGKRIVVQGGLFRNPAVLRAFENLIGGEVVRPDIAEMMGAYGAALTAQEQYLTQPEAATTFRGLESPSAEGEATRSQIRCRGCENRCAVTSIWFPGGRPYYTGNRCERHFSSSGRTHRVGENLFTLRLKLLFDRPLVPENGKPRLCFGIPRALNMYENFPFWSTLLTACGFQVVLSAPSDMALFEKGIATVMSDSLCFPGQLVHGHILDLLARRVDRIFYPIVVFEGKEGADTLNSFNCPVVTGYPDVIRSAIDPEGRYGVPIDRPVVSFKSIELLKKQLHLFLKEFGIGKRRVDQAVEKAMKAQQEVRRELQERGLALLTKAEREGRFVCVIAGRPYHCDSLINHGFPELLAGLGVDVIPESAVPLAADQGLKHTPILTQWAYTNRILAVAKVVAHTPHAEMLQITSFGCGIDAISADEVQEILRSRGKLYTLVKMDVITNLGAVRIRLRSMLDAIRERNVSVRAKAEEDHHNHRGGEGSCDQTILVPWFSPLYSPLIPSIFSSFGCRVELLAPQDRSCVEVGLKYVNNDMCYPAVIVIGDIIKALQSGKYDPAKTTVLLTQTFGQCRASNYLPLARKALAAAGFPRVPVYSLALDGRLADSGLAINQGQLLKRLSLGLIFSDALARMAMATTPREKEPGVTMALQQRYLLEMAALAGAGEFKPLLELLRKAVAEFNALPVVETETPVVGVIGEIFVKHNAFSNNDIVEWLIGQGVEVVVPPLLSFFEQYFVNEEYGQRAYLKSSLQDLVVSHVLDRYVRFYLARVEKVLAGFRYNRSSHDLRKLAAEATLATSLANQAGEGWLLPAEIIAMLKDGVQNIICLQPFGCLANQIVGKGIEKRLKSLYRQLNLLFLDMDPGTSEVNILNRLHFLVVSAREGAPRTREQS